ncbi:MAG TPA: TonB-dependent receptor [Gammaproteobacteria bacterium]|jgi:catecholate siderophore receptor|nr:TonB-dependent receptor [Gammaproteobacteria bacterium]
MRTPSRLPIDFVPSRPLLASAIGFALASTAALGQQGEPVAEVVVTGRAPGETLTSSKFTAPLLDTPKSVTVITEALIAETGSTSLVDALRTVPGITFNAGEGGQPAGDNLKIRGFDAGADVFIDGVRDAGSQTRDIFALEQVEVVKGPGSAYSGRGSSGGSVNLVTKKPRAEEFLVGDLAAGTDRYGRATVDANYRLGDSMGFRLNALAQDFDVPGRDGVGGTHRGLAPSFAFGMGKDTRVNLDFYRYTTDDVPDYSTPYARNAANTAPAGEPVQTDRGNFYGLLARDFQRTDADVRTLQVAHEFAGGLTLTNVTRYGRTTNDYIVTNPDDGRGNLVNGLVYRSPKSRNSVTTTAANVTSIAGRAKTGRIGHSYAAGIEASDEAMTNVPYVIQTAFAGNAATAFDTSCSAPGALAASAFNCTTLDNPNPYDPWVGTITRSATPTRVTTDTRAIYGFDTLTFNEHWSLNLGLRRDDYDTTQHGFASGVPQVLRNQAEFWNYQAGLVFKPKAHGSVYLSTGTSSSPSGNTLGDGTENLAVTNQDLAPERDRTYELGAKWQVAKRLTLTTAVFRTETANARVATASGLQAAIGDELVRGFEVGVSGNITDRWQVFSGFSFLDSEIVDDGPVATNDGNQFPNTPRNSFALWTSHAVSPRVTIGGGATYVDRRFGNVANTVWIPEYWRYDAMAAFAVSRKVNLQVNIQNLTDEVYFVRPYQNHYASMGPARSAVISARISF